MKRRRSESDDFASDAVPMPGMLSKDEVQRVISQEVHAAIEQSDKMMKALMERMQEIDGEPRYSTRIKKLEAQVKKVKRRGDVIFAHIQKSETSEFSQDQQRSLPSKCDPSPGPSQTLSSVTETTSFNSSAGASGDMSTTSAGFLGLCCCFSCQRSKKQRVDLTDEACRQMTGTQTDCSPATSTPEQRDVDTNLTPPEPSASPCLAVVKSPGAESVQAAAQIQFPPLPDTPFPQQLPVVAATKNVPQKPVVKVARISNPQSIALLWNVEEEDPHAADMDCYYIYVAQQYSDGTFSKWKTMGVVKAIPLPMACRVSDNSDGKTLCFILVGKDIYGRFGPYSDVQTVYGRKT